MARPLPPLRGGHRVQLLQGAREYFPALVAAIDSATRLVSLETYIFDFTNDSVSIAQALVRAARRGVEVRVMVDGVGTEPAPPPWPARFKEAGVHWRVFAPPGPLGLLWPGHWRRLHRKLCLVDGEVAFCGGINLLDDLHDLNHGALDSPRLDFSVRIEGPLVADVATTMERAWERLDAAHRMLLGHLPADRQASANSSAWTRGAEDIAPTMPGPDLVRATLVLRDNLRNRTAIERWYRRAIGRAHEEIIVANAYFVPGIRMRNALIQAAQRGVKVVLLLQGRYESFMQYYAARPIYGALLAAGVEIHEYSPSFLHAKVAVIDGHWSTVGSSNLDPLSLLLAREANIMVEDEAFGAELRARLLHAIEHEGRRMDASEYANRPLGQRLREELALVVMRLLLAIQGKKY